MPEPFKGTRTPPIPLIFACPALSSGNSGKRSFLITAYLVSAKRQTARATKKLLQDRRGREWRGEKQDERQGKKNMHTI